MIVDRSAAARLRPQVSMFLLLASVTALGAQERVRSETPIRTPAAALRMLESGERELLNGAHAVITAAFSENLRAYTDRERQELLDGVERIAKGGGRSASYEHRARAAEEAMAILCSIAYGADPRSSEAAGVPRRLIRVARDGVDSGSRNLAVLTFGIMLGSPVGGGRDVEDFLVSIAEDGRPSPPVWPGIAIAALEEGGERGKAILRRLHERKAVTNEAAREALEDLARRGFPTRQPRAARPGGPGGSGPAG